MAKLKYKSIIPNDKPMWLLKLQYTISEKHQHMALQGTMQEFDNLRTFINVGIAVLREQGDLRRSVVTTEIRTDEGRTVLHLFRNERIIQTYYIE